MWCSGEMKKCIAIGFLTIQLFWIKIHVWKLRVSNHSAICVADMQDVTPRISRRAFEHAQKTFRLIKQISRTVQGLLRAPHSIWKELHVLLIIRIVPSIPVDYFNCFGEGRHKIFGSNLQMASMYSFHAASSARSSKLRIWKRYNDYIEIKIYSIICTMVVCTQRDNQQEWCRVI